MAYTLAQLAEVEIDVLKKGILENIIRDAPVTENLPFEGVSSLAVYGLRVKSLPDVAFRDINETYTEATDAHVEEVWESVYVLGGEIRFDRLFQYVKNTVQDPKTFQTAMKVKAAAFKFNDYFINGDHAVDPKGFEGLTKRVAAMPASQSIYYAGVAGDATAALDPTAAIANARSFFDHLEEQWIATNQGNVTHIFCNQGMILGLGKALRYAGTNAGVGMLDTGKDSFDRTFYTYRGVKLFDMGLLKDQATQVITDTETANDAGADATSIYMASIGSGLDQLTGIQLHPLLSEQLPKTTSTSDGLLLEWPVGLCNFGSYCITRGRNVEGASNWT